MEQELRGPVDFVYPGYPIATLWTVGL